MDEGILIIKYSEVDEFGKENGGLSCRIHNTWNENIYPVCSHE